MAAGKREAAPAASLASKLAQVMQAIGDLAKEGHADVETKTGGRYSYDYITEADLMAALRPQLASRNVFPLVTDRVLFREGNLVSVEVTIVFWDGDTGEMSQAISGQGDGTDPGDKALSKAKTTAIRTLLSKTFLQGGGDQDPEQHHVERTGAPARVSDQQPPERRQEGPTRPVWTPTKTLEELERLGISEPKEWLKTALRFDYGIEASGWQDIPSEQRQEVLDKLIGVYTYLAEAGYDPTGLPPPDDDAVGEAFAANFPGYGEAAERWQAELSADEPEPMTADERAEAERVLQEDAQAQFAPEPGDVEGGEADGPEAGDSDAESAGGSERAEGPGGSGDDAPDGAESDEPGD
jgi:hypothetical protein